VKTEQRHRRIIEASEGGATADELADELGMAYQTINSACRYLRAHGLVEYEGTGAPGDPYVYRGRP
jgi:predicted ArsR family transcriptional regulator